MPFPSAPVMGDQKRLQQVIFNVGCFVIDHAVPGKKIVFKLNYDQESCKLNFQINDHGRGISPDAFN